MTLTEAVIEKLNRLPADKQQEVLEFVESLERRQRPAGPRRDLYGILKDKAIDVSLEEFKALRREMTRNFPRELPDD